MDIQYLAVLCLIVTVSSLSFIDLESCECPESEECYETTLKIPKIICIPALCLEDMVKGPCRARHIRWFYNVTAEMCESFFYGGCRGNENRFRTKEDCEDICMTNFIMK